MYEQLCDGSVPGVVAVDGGAHPLPDGKRVKVENVTVWSQRADMFKFFRSRIHTQAVAAFDGQFVFRVRRVWIKGLDLPDGEDRSAVDGFWSLLKSGRFEDATSSKTKQSVTYEDTDDLFKDDRDPPLTTFGYKQVIDERLLDNETKYFTVSIWGIGPVDLTERFTETFGDMYEQLCDGSVPGVVAVDGGAHPLPDGKRVKVENVTVWAERSDMLKFFRSPLHKAAMEAFDGELAFRVKRMWVKGVNLPDGSSKNSIDTFWEELKADRFEAATSSVAKEQVTYTDTDELFKADTNAPKTLGYQQIIDKSKLVMDKEYFTVSVWGLGSCDLVERFNETFGDMYGKLADGTVPGVVVVDGGGELLPDGKRVKVENVTVWADRSDMLVFFRSPLHLAAVSAFDGMLTFRVRRFVVKGADLPDPKSKPAIDAFWKKIKTESFESAR